MPEELTNPGLIEDPRSEEAKLRDYQHEEIASSAVALHWNRGIDQAPLYSLRDQDGSGSCVGQAAAKALEVLKGEVISAHPVYARRFNYPGFGMYLQNAGEIVRNNGTTTEFLDPSQNMTESQMNALVTVPTPYKDYTYAFVDVSDIDKVAQAIEVQKHCLITIRGNLQEYAYSQKPIATGAEFNFAHCICGVYYFTDGDGQRCILIDESWGPNNIRRRVITESYLKERGTAAMYFVAPNVVTPVKPKFKFTIPLSFGMMNSLGVKNLQDILKYESLFPANIFSTGNYLEVTRKSVLAWQRKHHVASEQELNALQGRRVGQKTINKLNELYS